MDRKYYYITTSLVLFAILVGIMIGLSVYVPENITIDVGDNYIEVIDRMEKLNLTINNENCPDCICIEGEIDKTRTRKFDTCFMVYFDVNDPFYVCEGERE